MNFDNFFDDISCPDKHHTIHSDSVDIQGFIQVMHLYVMNKNVVSNMNFIVFYTITSFITKVNI